MNEELRKILKEVVMAQSKGRS